MELWENREVHKYSLKDPDSCFLGNIGRKGRGSATRTENKVMTNRINGEYLMPHTKCALVCHPRKTFSTHMPSWFGSSFQKAGQFFLLWGLAYFAVAEMNYMPSTKQTETAWKEPPIPDRVFTLEELRRYDGSDPSLPIYIGLKVNPLKYEYSKHSTSLQVCRSCMTLESQAARPIVIVCYFQGTQRTCFSRVIGMDPCMETHTALHAQDSLCKHAV